MYCRVRCCRFAGTHVTAGHKCGGCGRHGHGQRECGNRVAIARLRYDSAHDALPPAMWCQEDGCPFPWSHTSSAHATSCDARLPDADTRRKCPHCNAVGPVDLDKLYFTNSECTVCMESKPCVLFEACRHINVCAACAERLPPS